jgi:hypothetical protein
VFSIVSRKSDGITKGWNHSINFRPGSEEFSRVIGADVRVRAVSIELAPGTPVQLRLDIQAPWLEEMRNDKNHGSWSGFGEKPYWPYLPAQIESCSHPDLRRCWGWG